MVVMSGNGGGRSWQLLLLLSMVAVRVGTCDFDGIFGGAVADGGGGGGW